MPRVPDGYLESVVYLYQSAFEATRGEHQGGSGCLVYVPSSVYPDRGYTYVVTNSHVLREGGCLTVRLNGKDAEPVVLETTANDWIHHPDGDDVAVYHISGTMVKQAQMRVLSVNRFLTPEIIKENEIGPGSDVFMAGRFIDYEGVQRNTPSLRFGNISMMSPEPILNERGFRQDSFLVEMRSIVGYSGSPVMVYIPLLGSFGEITADTVPHMAIMDST